MPAPSTTPAIPTSPSTVSWRWSGPAPAASWPAARTRTTTAPLRADPVFKLLADRSPEDHDLAIQPTLSRFENAFTIKPLKRLRDVLRGAERQRQFRLRRQPDPPRRQLCTAWSLLRYRSNAARAFVEAVRAEATRQHRQASVSTLVGWLVRWSPGRPTSAGPYHATEQRVAGSPWAVARPGLPRIRTCPIKASG